MIRIFRNIRQQLAAENKVARYLRYAIGEIVLVVIGILIALQINNLNDKAKERQKELHYLGNIKTDLQMTIAEIDRTLAVRSQCIIGAKAMLRHFEGEPVTDWEAFNANGIINYSWQKFYQNNNTFQELINSGNLALIRSDSIKNTLMDMEALYVKLKSEEDHFRYDTEKLFYEPLYEGYDLYPWTQNFAYRMSGGQAGTHVKLVPEMFEGFFQNNKIKNGFVMVVLMLGPMNSMMEQMQQQAQTLIRLIDQERGGVSES
jgi:hypothetical protein